MSTVHAPAQPQSASHPEGISGGRATGFWGMVMLIFTEATLFGILLFSYFYLRFQSQPVWPPEGIDKPDLFLVSIMTPILLLSSGPMHWAHTGIRQGKVGRLRLGLLATFVMGATFLGFQGVEYREILTDQFTPRTNVYGSLFFTITGFHGLHVAVGLVMNLWVQWFAGRGRFTAERHLAVENVALYWHFVDAVWVFILFSLYLSPHLWS
ncbi:MAG TPA: heme-copper oxidase subunit III [Actinomycetota bacterium]|nr:heme-copper oxidase subunit III [Actinomycetota bacterium]